MKVKDKVLISVVGKNGTGKSYFGRYVRKNGLSRFDKKNIVVIDDRVMTLDFLIFFKKRLKIPRNGVDELQPYLKKLPGRKKIVFYINNTPSDKISKADIMLKLTTDESIRKSRLENRYSHDPGRLMKTVHAGSDVGDYGIKYSYLIEANV